MAWVAYVGRLFAAIVLVGLAAVFAMLAMSDKKSASFLVGASAVFAVAGLFTWPRRPNAWRSDPPTERQLAFARDLGIRVPKGISKGDLSELISEAKAIRDAF